MNRSQRIRLYPTPEQESYFRQCVGAARHAYNWGLAVRLRYYRMYGKIVGWVRLLKKWCVLKQPGKAKAWASGVSKIVTEQAIRHMDAAYTAWFKYMRKKSAGVSCPKVGRPKFKRKSKAKRVFKASVECRTVRIARGKIKLPTTGWIRYRSAIRWPSAPIRVATVHEQGGKWYLIATFELPDPKPATHSGPACGIDLGCTTFATIASKGVVVDEVKPPKPYAKAKRKLKRAGRVMSRRKLGGKNREKARKKLSRLHFRVANVRSDFLHKLSRNVVTNYGQTVLEDLNMSALSKGLHRRSVADLGWGEFRRQVEYKAMETGAKVLFADRYFPSTKMCSSCGFVNHTVTLGVQEWSCPSCFSVHNRDHNAALNLEKLAGGTGEVTPTEIGGSSVERKFNGGADQGSRKVSIIG